MGTATDTWPWWDERYIEPAWFWILPGSEEHWPKPAIRLPCGTDLRWSVPSRTIGSPHPAGVRCSLGPSLQRGDFHAFQSCQCCHLRDVQCITKFGIPDHIYLCDIVPCRIRRRLPLIVSMDQDTRMFTLAEDLAKGTKAVCGIKLLTRYYPRLSLPRPWGFNDVDFRTALTPQWGANLVDSNVIKSAEALNC